MSAFIVMNGTIDNAVTALAPWHMTGDEAGTKLGRLLLALNIRAVCDRYDESELEYGHLIDAYTYTEQKQSEVQNLKSLNCLLYQCAEGDVPETSDLYKRMDHHATLMTEALAKGRQKESFGEMRPFVAGYDDAKWDQPRVVGTEA